MSWRGNGPGTFDGTSMMGEERRSDILKLILYDLNSAIAPQDHRLVALQTAISEFDHDQDFKHDEELDLHADKILFQKLAFAFQVDRSSEEVAMICTALEMVYRASRSRVALSFAELRESVLPIFVEMLGKPLHLRKQEELDVAVIEQEEKLNSIHDFSRRTSATSTVRSNQSQSLPSFSKAGDVSRASSRSQSVEEMSLQSAGQDDPTFMSFQGMQKTSISMDAPDDQSFITYDEQSLQKPAKKLDYDDQTYQSEDPGPYKGGSEASRDEEQRSHDDHTFQTYDQPTFSKGHLGDDQTYQNYDRTSQQGSNRDDATFQTYDRDDPTHHSTPSNYKSDNTYASQDRSLSKAPSVYDDASFSSYDHSVQKPQARDAASYVDSIADDTYEDSQTFAEGTISEDIEKPSAGELASYGDNDTYEGSQTFAEATIVDDHSKPGEAYDKGMKQGLNGDDEQTYDDGTYQDQLTYDDGTYQDENSLAMQTYDDGTYHDSQSQGEQTFDDGTYQDEHTQAMQTYDDGTYQDGRSQAKQTFDDDTYQDGRSQDEQTYDDGTFQDGQSQDEQTYDNGTYQDGYSQDEQTYDNGTYQDGYSQDEQTYDDGTHQDGQSQDEQTFGDGTYQDGYSHNEQTMEEASRGHSQNQQKSIMFHGDESHRSGRSSHADQSKRSGRSSHTEESQRSGRSSNADKSQRSGRSFHEEESQRSSQSSQLNQSHRSGISHGLSQDDMYDQRTYDEGTYNGGTDDNRTYDEGTYADEGTNPDGGTYADEGTYADGTFAHEGTYAEEKTYDEGTYADEDTYDNGTYADEGTFDEGTVGQSTIRTEDVSKDANTTVTYRGEEQSLQPTTYSEREGKFNDDQSKAGRSYSSFGERSLQPSKYGSDAFGKEQQFEDQSLQPSHTEYSQQESYKPHSTDEMSVFTEDQSVADYPQKPSSKEMYDVETVYSDDDDESQDHSLISKGSLGKGSQGVPSKNIQDPSLRKGRSSGLSTVAEESHEESSYTPSQQSFVKSKSSSHSMPSKSPSMTSIPESGTQRSERSSVASSSNILKAKKMDQEKKMNEQIARLEAELEMIRVEDATNPVGVSRTLQVLRYFSRVLSAMVPMAHHPGLLDSLVYQLERQSYGKHADHFHAYDDGEPRTEEDKEELAAARVDAIATIVNLACAEENKAKMATHPGLLDAITSVAQGDPSEEAREHAAIVLMNLAYEDENKEVMVMHPHMLDTLVRLIQDDSPFTRRYASAAMFTLACVVGNTEKMAVYCDGEILECLRRVLSDDPVDEARINSSEALFNMARNNTEESLQIMGDHPRLLATLAKAVLTDYSADVRVFCARALEWMSAGIHYPADCHRLLLSALTVSAQWTKTSCIAEAMKTQATLAENRRPMAAHDGLLQALSNLALLESLSDKDVRKSAVAALEMITREPEARPFMVRNDQVMQALTKASFEHAEDEVYGEDGEGTAVTNKLLKQALKNLSYEM